MTADTQIASHSEPEHRTLENFLCGCAAMVRSPLIVAPAGMFMGFGALAHDTGFSIAWTALASMLMFGTPGQILLVTGISHDAALLTIAVGVTLTAVRFAPMVATLLSLMKFPGGRAWHVFFPVHCTVVSLWLEALRLLPGLPREQRVAFCNGLTAAVFSVGIIATVAGYYLAGAMPPLFAAALLFVTPISFLVGTASSSKTLVDKLALAFGLGLATGAWLLGITFDLLWIGVIAGTAAYGIHRTQQRWAWAT